MANYPNYDLFGKRPADTFRNLVQFNETASNLVDSYGDDLPQLAITASVEGTSSWANNAVSASWSPDQTVTVESASWASQSLSSSWAPFTQTEQISASWASSSLSASWVPNIYPQIEQISASWATQSLSSSWTPNLYPQVEQISASWASASLSASWVPDLYPQTEQVSASWASASFSSSYAMTASALTPSSGLTTDVYISASNGDITMSFVNGLLISVT